ncbi:MAG TPA: SRPBCC family protein [Anaerolineales bacterium]
MVSVEISIIINRPVADVFTYVANFENHPKWETDFQEVKLLTAMPSGVGTTYRCVLKFPGQTATSKFEITEYDLNRKISFVGEPAGPAVPKGSFLFESVGNGTKITSLPRPEFRGFFRLLEPMMAGYIRKNNVTHLNNLKQLLER